MTSEQLLVITQLLNQVDPISIREDKDAGDDYWVLDLGDGKEIDTYSNGDQFWCQNGKIHRVDGPAVIYANGAQFWWLNNKVLFETEHAKAVALLKQETK